MSGLFSPIVCTVSFLDFFNDWIEYSAGSSNYKFGQKVTSEKILSHLHQLFSKIAGW